MYSKVRWTGLRIKHEIYTILIKHIYGNKTQKKKKLILMQTRMNFECF